MIERTHFIMTFAATVALAVAGGIVILLARGESPGAILASFADIQWLDALLAVIVGVASIAALGGLIALMIGIMQRVDPIWAAGGALAVDDDHNLTISAKRFLRVPEPTSTVHLDRAAFATWYISPFSRSGTLSIELWDRDPQLTFGICGLMSNSGAKPITEISTRILDDSPTATARLQHYLEQRIDAGTLECNFTPQGFEPIPELLPPLEPGITFSADGREIRYRKPDPDETL